MEDISDTQAGTPTRGWVGWAGAGLVGYSVVVAPGHLFVLWLFGANRVAFDAAVVATALYTPLSVALTVGAVRGRRPRGATVMLSAMAVIIFAVVPLAGPTWPRAFGPLAFAALIVLRRPWSMLSYGVLCVLPVPVTYLLGAPAAWVRGSSAVAYTFGPYCIVWLITSLRELDAARAAAAAAAVTRERGRIDEQLRRTLGADLAAIVERVERAGVLMDADAAPARIRGELDELVGRSRGALTAARRLIRGYRRPPLPVEFDTALNLLRANGIHAVLTLPDNGLTAPEEDRVRTGVRAAVLEMLRDAPPGSWRIIVDRRDGQVDVRHEQGGGTEVRG